MLSDHCLCVLSVSDVGVLWPNAWMDQDETWHGGRPQPRPHRIRWGPSSPSPKGAQPLPQFLAHVCCGQTAGCIKMPLGTEVDLGPGNIVLDGDAAPPPPPKKGGHSTPSCGPCIVAKRLHGSRCHLLRGRPRPRPHCVTGRPSSPLRGAQQPPIFDPCLLWPNCWMPNGWMDQDATWYGGRPRPWPHCVRWGPTVSPKGAQPQFSAHVCCTQTARWIKMPLGTEVDLGPAYINCVRWGPDPARKGTQQPPCFGPLSIVTKRSPISATAELVSDCQ